MCLWNTEDGRCLESSKTNYTHTSIQTFQVSERECRIYCIGYYSEILVIDPRTFEIHYRLTSTIEPDWISSMHVLQTPTSSNIVVIGLTVSGIVRIWTILDNEGKSLDPIYDNDSKSLACTNSVKLVSNPYSMRLVLIVCSKYWQIFDASDFTPLCTANARPNEHWVGGSFVSQDHVVTWTDYGQGHVYKIPTSRHSKSDQSRIGNPENNENNPNILNQPKLEWPKLCVVLSRPKDIRLLCPPAMTFALLPPITIDDKKDVPAPQETTSVSNNPTSPTNKAAPTFASNFYERLHQLDISEKLLIRGDSSGQVTVWSIPSPSALLNYQNNDLNKTTTRLPSLEDRPMEVIPHLTNSLRSAWKAMRPPPCGILDQLSTGEERSYKITASVYLPVQGRLVCGRENGSIIVSSATRIAMLGLLSGLHQAESDWPQYQIFYGHSGRINCLLYPHNVNSRYDASHLVSGGVDFCVCLWDLYEGVLLHKFCVHAGEITQFLVPPSETSPRVLSSICSIASDHTVSLLNLKEKKCIMLASRHLFPISTIKWKPAEDSMVVGCVDGSAYVWRMGTGHLLKVAQGVAAEETLASCDGVTLSKDGLTNPALELFKGLRQRNLSAIKHAAARGLHQLATNQQQAKDVVDLSARFRSHPLTIQGLRTNPRDQDSHVMFFDVEALIVQLLHEEYSKMSPNTLESNGLTNTLEYQRFMHTCSPESHRFSGLLAKVKDTAEIAAQRIQAGADLGIKNVTSEIERLNQLYKRNFAADSSQTDLAEGQKNTRPNKMAISESRLMMEIVQILLSLLHAWGLDKELDRICDLKLGLLRPLRPVCFGLISRGCYMAMLLPCYVQRLDSRSRRRKQQLNQQMISNDSTDQAPLRTEQERARRFVSRFHWELSTAVTTTHLLAIISLANTLMSMNSVTFIQGIYKSVASEENTDDEDDNRLSTSTTHKVTNNPAALIGDSSSTIDTIQDSEKESTARMETSDTDEHTSNTQQEIKQGWSVLAALHCVLLPELVRSSNFKKPLVDVLARRWQDRCLEVREAARALLLAELRRIGSRGRKQVVDEWSSFLPAYNERINAITQIQANLQSSTPSVMSASSTNQSLSSIENSSQPQSTTPVVHHSNDSQGSSTSGNMNVGEIAESSSNINNDQDDDMEEPEENMSEQTKRSLSSAECRRKEATAIVLLGVIGAEYGQEIEQNKRKQQAAIAEANGSDNANLDNPAKHKSPPIEGFGGTNYSLARHTSQALSYLLLQHPSNIAIPQHTSLRRTAVDLIGRGFTVWEPYLDIAKVLLGLLDLCCESERLVPSMSFGLPLTPASDSCRTARHAISLIATARPSVFITTLAREVARFNNKQRSTHNLNVSTLNQTVLGKARPEILRNVELLIEKMQLEVANLIVEMMDITLHCLDHSQLKNRGLREVFPAITRFHMVSYCPATRRIAVGTMTGNLAIYELRAQSKSQMIPAHNSSITSCSFSPDGKYLASYSIGDNRLCFWLTASGLFGLGNARTRCVGTIDTPPVPEELICNGSDSLRLARLIWVASKIVILMFIDGKELRYQVA